MSRFGIRTVNPSDGQRLEDGEEQQAGSTAGEMVIDLEHVQTSLRHRGNKHYYISLKTTQKIIYTFTHIHPSTLGVTYRRDHDQSDQEADDTDKQQQQLSAVTSSDQVRVKVSH